MDNFCEERRCNALLKWVLDAKVAPRRVPEGAREAPREAKRCPREAQELPRGLQEWTPESNYFVTVFFRDFCLVPMISKENAMFVFKWGSMKKLRVF